LKLGAQFLEKSEHLILHFNIFFFLFVFDLREAYIKFVQSEDIIQAQKKTDIGGLGLK